MNQAALREVRRHFTRAVETGQFQLDSLALTKRELQDQLDLVELPLGSARAEAERGVFPGAGLARAYDAAVVAANAVVAAMGYRGRGEGGHENVLRAAAGILHALGERSSRQDLEEVRQWMRPLRHSAQYESARMVTHADMGAALALAERTTTRLAALTRQLADLP